MNESAGWAPAVGLWEADRVTRIVSCPWSLAIAALLACGPPPVAGPVAPEAVRIVATERGPAGGRLVVIDEQGDRRAELTAPAETPSRDNSAAFSPDGRWVVFASTRGRSLERTSIWIVRAEFGAVPVRLTVGDAVDLEPAWMPDGKSVVFASDRDGGVDLWRIEVLLDGDRPRVGALSRLTRTLVLERTPSVAADGRIAYTAMTPGEGGAVSSRIEVRAPDGTITAVTRGPGDATPSFSPDGTRIAFAGPHVREGGAVDGDIWSTPATGGDVTIALDAPGTDEAGPVWSRDGRWLFATSLVRKADTGEALLSAVVHVDREERPPVVRMLVDRAGAVARLAPAIAPGTLDAAVLRKTPVYRDELARILYRALERNEREKAAAPPRE